MMSHDVNGYISDQATRQYEETPLLERSPTHNLDGASIRVLLIKQKHVYSSITLADVFQKVAFTTILTSFLVFGSSYLGYQHVNLLQAYFAFTSFLWLITSATNLCCPSKKHVILIGFILYFLGLASLTGLTRHFHDVNIFQYIVLVPLVLICLGEAFCRSCIGEFGHHQFEDARLSDKLRRYSQILYWVGNTCAVLLILALLGICEAGSYVLGMGLCCVCIAFGGISFLRGWTHFRSTETSRSSLRLLGEIVSNAKTVRRNTLTTTNQQHWLDFAKAEHSGNFSAPEVEEAKSVFKVMFILFSLVPYWICNAQGYSTFIFQGFHLNFDVGSVAIPVSWTALCNIASVLVFLKVSEKYIYPALRKQGYFFPTSWRVITGMFMTLLSMGLAGGVQLSAYSSATQQPGGVKLHKIGEINVTYVEDVNILLTIPQYVFLGLSEVLVGVTTLTLACKLCPVTFRKLVTGVYYFTVMLGHIVSLIIVSCGWFPSGKYLAGFEMVVYFFSLAGLSVLGMLTYLYAIAESRTPIVGENYPVTS